MATRTRPRSSGTTYSGDYYQDYTNATPQEYEQTERLKRRRTTRETPDIRVVGSVDYALLFVVILLVLFGVIMVFSSSHMISNRIFGHPFNFFINTLIFAGIGFVVMLFLANFNYELLRPLSTFVYAISIGLLILVILFGEEIHGARRWINIGTFQFQPSELARAGLIFTMAYLIEKYPGLPKTFRGIFALTLVVGVIVALIVFPGGLSVGIITTAVGLGMIAVASPHFTKLGIFGGIVGGGLVGFLHWQYVTGGGFRGARYGAWLDPFAYRLNTGYQTVQSLLAISSGSWFGLGVGQSHQVSFVPEAMNDIIFAIAVEEFGFVGAVLIIAMFGVFIWRGILIAMRAPDTYSAMIAIGIVFAIGFQAIINIAVVTNTIPNTGVNLPFISYGGTSLIVTMALVGVLLNISRYSKQK